MSKCKDCKYFESGSFEFNGKHYTTAACTLSHLVVVPDKEINCAYFNADLSSENICYNCRYYIGGGDWGLFCSHKDKYHHLGKFNDEACEDFERK